MKSKKLSMVLKAPLILTVLSSFAASVYAAYKGLAGVNWFSPVFFAVILILYYLGTRVKQEVE